MRIILNYKEYKQAYTQGNKYLLKRNIIYTLHYDGR